MKEYYTPAIEEFHVGFKCEKLYFNDHPTHKGERLVWGEEIIDKYLLGDIIEDEDPEYIINNYRVKYLDREDIESCGWKYQHSTFEFEAKSSKQMLAFTKDTYLLKYIPENQSLRIDDDYIDMIQFCGFIKNISELKKLMKQLNIQTT